MLRPKPHGAIAVDPLHQFWIRLALGVKPADLIQQRRAEEALRGSEERLREFGEASHDFLWTRGTKTLQWQNLTPAFETIYGLSRAEALALASIGVAGVNPRVATAEGGSGLGRPPDRKHNGGSEIGQPPWQRHLDHSRSRFVGGTTLSAGQVIG
jgi:PAS domain-containing protein